jgi:trans-aconitate methyltransferase
VARGSQWNAGLYDDKHSFVWKMAAGLLDLLEAKSGELILDLGCGTGHLTAQIAATGANVVGIDKSPDMIQQAREKYPSLRFEVMDAREIAFKESFDAVFSNATLHWIKEPERAISGIARALRTGGRFVAEFGGKGNVGALMAAIEQAWLKVGLAGSAPKPWYYPSVAEYSGLLEKHSLEVTYANLFERPTPLEDGERGLRNWLEMFGGAVFEKLTPGEQGDVLAAVEQEARPALLRDGHWVMDYRRLRVVARKAAGLAAK